jgi:GlpG protein
MRLIGHLETEAQARTFGDYLYAQDIQSLIEEETGGWAVWVHAEDQLEAATRLLHEFRKSPEDRKFTKAQRVAQQKRERTEAQNEAARKKFFDRTALSRSHLGRLGWVTAVLMGISLVLTFLTAFGSNTRVFSWFTIVPLIQEGPFLTARRDFGALLTWQVWRWFTPVFVHMGVLHILFNLWWLKDLGTVLENHLGRWHFLALVLFIAGPSNAAQYLVVDPLFGGMSGVIYGLLAYLWVRSRLDPFSGLFIHPTTITIMGIWYFLCLFGVIPHVANTAHTGGLIVGALAGWTAARRR